MLINQNVVMKIKLIIILITSVILAHTERVSKIGEYEFVEEQVIKSVNSDDTEITILRFTAVKCPDGQKRDKKGVCRAALE